MQRHIEAKSRSTCVLDVLSEVCGETAGEGLEIFEIIRLLFWRLALNQLFYQLLGHLGRVVFDLYDELELNFLLFSCDHTC